MGKSYTIRVITFSHGENPSPWKEIHDNESSMRYIDEIPGIGISQFDYLCNSTNPRDLGGWICRGIGDGERYKQVIVNMALTALIDNYTPFVAIGSLLNPDDNYLSRVALWQLWHSKESDYRLWIKKELIGKYPQLVHSIPSFDSYHSQRSISFDLDPLLRMNIC